MSGKRLSMLLTGTQLSRGRGGGGGERTMDKILSSQYLMKRMGRKKRRL